MNDRYRVYRTPTNNDLEDFLNQQSKMGWEFVALVPEDRLVFRNVDWDPNSQTFKVRGEKR